MNIPFGATVRDEITGMIGIVIARTEHMTGHVYCGFIPRSNDTPTVEPALVWIAQERLQVLDYELLKLPGDHRDVENLAAQEKLS
jgi:hypothetical protein